MPKVRLPSLRLNGLLPAVLLSVLLTACSPGGLFEGNMMYAPHRAQESGAPVLESALIALTEGDRAGQVKLTEDEFASLLRAVLVNTTDEQTLIRDVQVWLEPDTVYLKILLREGAFPRIPTGVALNVEGGLRTADGRLRFDLRRAGRGRHPRRIARPAGHTGRPARGRCGRARGPGVATRRDGGFRRHHHRRTLTRRSSVRLRRRFPAKPRQHSLQACS